MIPEAKKTAVKNALQLTFGVNEFEDIRQLTAGLSSALIFRIVVKGKPYLLRIITSTDAVSDPAHWYDCMKAAAGAGIAPHVWYTSAEDRVAITDFIEAKPFPLTKAAVLLPDMIKRLQALPLFPFRLNYFDVVDGFVQKFKDANILPESITEEVFTHYKRITDVYPRDRNQFVPCHNDLKPENILFDGHRAWLVDWEAAFLNDRYMDLSIVANFAVTNEDEEKAFLATYLEEAVTGYHLARFYLMRQVLHVSYFTFFMLLVSRAGCQIDTGSAKPAFREFHNRMWSGEIDLGNNERRQEYAWVHMEQLKHNLQQKRFEDSLRIVSDYQSR
jgi:thiamine kinase-like enzyme